MHPTEKIDRILAADLTQKTFTTVLTASALVVMAVGLVMHFASPPTQLAVAFVAVPLFFAYLGFVIFIISRVNIAGKQRAMAFKAVNSGDISPTWGVAGPLFSGILLVDEQNSRVYINGRVIKAADLRSVAINTWSKAGRRAYWIALNIGGPSPMQYLRISSLKACETTAARLTNFAGLT